MTVSFSESDVNKLKVGQAATVTPDALSGVQLGAHVTSISPVGTTSNNVVSYQATLTLDQNDSSVRPGMRFFWKYQKCSWYSSRALASVSAT